jgi:UV DNA damage endonuclease
LPSGRAGCAWRRTGKVNTGAAAYCPFVKIGYPCINRSIGCSPGRTFRLASYSEERLIRAVENNLACLRRILQFNLEHGILFFRITSDLVPFASHPVCTAEWQEIFAEDFRAVGRLIGRHEMRISMHPDQFVLINAKDPEIVKRSRAELAYHAAVLDAMCLDPTARIQIHVGGVYGDREASINRFCREYGRLDEAVRRRLVVENDDSRYTVADCLRIHRETSIPVLFDSFHHQVNSSGEPVDEAAERCSGTWGADDGILMVDYSTQEQGGRKGKHAESLDTDHFLEFLRATAPTDMDIMLEIKDKEKSAVRAIEVAIRDGRFLLPTERP